ncbi:MAG TPA: hypothetical protein VHP32_06725 [Ignavibacteria bacterium]|nr:hypothetical protein [Ignavibacteria bacterium]
MKKILLVFILLSFQACNNNKTETINYDWTGLYLFEDGYDKRYVKIHPDGTAVFSAEDYFGLIYVINCNTKDKDSIIEIFYKGITVNNIAGHEIIKNEDMPLYIFSYEHDLLYTQTQFSDPPLEKKYIYFKKQ